jgi:hypothetical protein
MLRMVGAVRRPYPARPVDTASCSAHPSTIYGHHCVLLSTVIKARKRRRASYEREDGEYVDQPPAALN